MHIADKMSLIESKNYVTGRIEKRQIIEHVVYVINLLLIFSLNS